MIQFHPSALSNFNAKADLLRTLLKEVERPIYKPSPLTSDLPTALTITDSEIIGDIQESVSDYRGNIKGRFFTINKKRFGIVDEDHEKLIDLAESIQRTASIREVLSQKYIENKIFEWLKEFHAKVSDFDNFTNYLKKTSIQDIRSYTIYVPIASTIVEEDFSFCGEIVLNLSKDIFDSLFPALGKMPDEDKQKASTYFNKLRTDFQGRAAVKISLDCEFDYANTIAIKKSQTITRLLGLYSEAMIIPDYKSTSKIKGCENIEQFTMFSQTQDGSLTSSSGILDQTSINNWIICKDSLVKFREHGLDKLSFLYCKQNPNDFELTILNTTHLYSRAAFTSNPMEKLVYVLSSLESTLLKNESEPIQQNLAERMAIFSVRDLQDRKNIIKNVKSIYSLRSKYLHHGHTSSELQELQKFFVNAWVFYITLVANHALFKSKDQFINAIEDQKLG